MDYRKFSGKFNHWLRVDIIERLINAQNNIAIVEKYPKQIDKELKHRWK